MAIKSTGDAKKGAKQPAPFLPKLSVSIVQGFIRIYGRLHGELDNAKDDRDALIKPEQPKEIMDHTAGLMPLFGVDIAPTTTALSK